MPKLKMYVSTAATAICILCARSVCHAETVKDVPLSSQLSVADAPSCAYVYHVTLAGYQVDISTNTTSHMPTKTPLSRQLNISIADLTYVPFYDEKHDSVGLTKTTTNAKRRLERAESHRRIEMERALYAVDSVSGERKYHVSQEAAVFQSRKNLPAQFGNILFVTSIKDQEASPSSVPQKYLRISPNSDSTTDKLVFDFFKDGHLAQRSTLDQQSLKQLFATPSARELPSGCGSVPAPSKSRRAAQVFF